MLDPEFEKEVRRKLEDLEFSPSDSVWLRVEDEVNHKEKRRVPLLWFFLLGAFVLGGAIWPFYGTRHAAHPLTSVHPVPAPPERDEKRPSSNAPQAITQPPTGPASRTTHRVIASIERNTRRHSGLTVMPKSITQLAGNAAQARTDKELEQSIVEDLAAHRNDTGTGKDSLSANPADHPQAPVTANNQPAAASAAAASATSSPAKTADPKPSNETARWTWSLRGSAGFSSITQSLFSPAPVVNAVSYASVLYNGMPAAAPVYFGPSPLQPGFSFALGASVQRSLGKRFYVSGELQYHYASTRIQTGPELSYSYLSTGSAYRDGRSNTYTNNYHLLELPVTAGFRITTGLPLYWELGASVSELLGTNALHYDYNTRSYFKDKSLFNSTQVNGTTAILYGLKLGRQPLRIGPEAQYGLTNLLNASTGNKEHLYYVGIRFDLVFQEK